MAPSHALYMSPSSLEVVNSISGPQASFFLSTKFTNFSQSPGPKLISAAKPYIMFRLEYLLVNRISPCPYKGSPFSSSQNFSHLSTLLSLSIVHTRLNEDYIHFFLKTHTKFKERLKQSCPNTTYTNRKKCHLSE